MTYRVLSLFAGGGGLDMGLERSGAGVTVAHVEANPHARCVLDDLWPEVPCYDDVRTVTARGLLADGVRPNAIAAGFPCQDISLANVQGRGLDGERSGLWSHIPRLLDEFEECGQPIDLLVLENVSAILGRGLGRVLGDLAARGFNAWWDCIPLSALGAPHRRDRWFAVAYPERAGRERLVAFHSLLGSEIAALAKSGNPFADAWGVLDGGFHGLRAGDGLSVAMERRRLQMCGNSASPVTPYIIGRAILAAEQELRRAA